jgi:acetyl-CoA carboxylase biotin carboxyl carrier protein
MNVKEIKEILEMMETYGLQEFEFEKNGTKVKLSKSAGGAITVSPQSFVAPIAPQAVVPAPAAGGEVPAPADDPNTHIVRSPMVGTFYSSPAPDKPPFAQKNQDVKVDEVLCIVEAMKLMNEIKSEVSGKVIEVLVDSGTPVEFDQPLFKIQT